MWLLFLARGMKVFCFFCTSRLKVTIDVTILLLFARTATHVQAGTHVRARESEGTAYVVVDSGTLFEFFLFFFIFFLHVRPRMYGLL